MKMNEQRLGIPAGFMIDSIRAPKDSVDQWGADISEEQLTAFLDKSLLNDGNSLEQQISVISKIIAALRRAGFSPEQITEIVADPDADDHQEIIRSSVKGSSFTLEQMIRSRIDSYAAKVEEVIHTTVAVDREIARGLKKPEEAIVVKDFQISLLPFKDGEGEGVKWVVSHFNVPYNKFVN